MTEIRPKFVSLLANWYSGATLTTILLNSHSQIVSNGESMYFDENDTRRYDCACGKYIEECEFFRTAASHMMLGDGAGWNKNIFVHVPAFSRNPIIRSFLRSWRYEGRIRELFIDSYRPYREMRDAFLRAQVEFFDNAKRISGASIYMDGTKSIRRAQLFARNAAGKEGLRGMRAIHLVRDGRAFCYSYMKNENGRRTLRDASDTWLRYVAQVDTFMETFPQVPVLTVRHEDLCRSTVETVKRICNFLEIPYEDVRTGAGKEAHILGHEMRRVFRGEIKEDTSWQTKLDPGALSALSSTMRGQLKRFGYL